MKKWYNESYFDRKNWILENFDKLNLTTDETLLILLVDLCKINKVYVTQEYLLKKLKKTPKQLDAIIANLVAKHYLKIRNNAKGLIFDFDDIFEFDPAKYEIIDNKNLFDIVSDVFGKPLSPNDLQKMTDLINKYGEKKFNEALRIAEANKKLSMSYVEGVLRNEK